MLIVSDIYKDEKTRDEENSEADNNAENEEEANLLQNYQYPTSDSDVFNNIHEIAHGEGY